MKKAPQKTAPSISHEQAGNDGVLIVHAGLDLCNMISMTVR